MKGREKQRNNYPKAGKSYPQKKKFREVDGGEEAARAATAAS